MVFVPLHTEPWAKFARGLKSVEVRNSESPVALQVRKAVREGLADVPVILRLGWSSPKGQPLRQMRGILGRVWEGPWEEMPAWAREGSAVDWTVKDSPFFHKHSRLLFFEVLDVHADVPQDPRAAMLAGMAAGRAILRGAPL